MDPRVAAVVPVLYVRDAAASEAFYRLFGFVVDREGGAGDARWIYLRCGAHTVLLAEVHPPLVQVELPLAVYVYVVDLAGTLATLAAAGVATEHVGYPDHAPGGEARAVDPDGNVVLCGQPTAVPEADRVAPTGPPARFTLIKQAAEEVARRGGAPARCQVGQADGRPCSRSAEVKLADPWGDTAWACVAHAEEALIAASAVFIAREPEGGLASFLRGRAARRTP
ncbi:hypothetical protein GCM10010124_36380 [Pilimelia terevasa]|uniref:Glyoxalase/fosfomycin resistance/dioxygenase domain-containing protein n=1 Tax=Pilimelia terevasa TaxID=53372 RepID=A0A8J3BPX2_9ACTN|nr:VOC family protein [Pilimelia terevasa]GGK40361.1 hypothetical protein GCM10010124_36380 [Pilimelia terevasa]